MSFKRLLSILLATALLCVNGLCLPALAEEVVEAEPVEKAVEVVEAAEVSEPEPVKEEPKEVSAQEEPAKEEPAKEEPKEEPKQEPAKEEPKEEPKQEPAKEEPKQEPAKEEPKQDDPTKAPETEAPVHSDETQAPADTETPADPETPAPTGDDATAEPAQPTEDAPATDVPATDVPATDVPATDVPEVTEAPTPAPTATPEPTPIPEAPEITSLSADKDVVLMGESASFSFSAKHAMRLKYSITGAGSGSGTLSSDATRYSFTADREGRYTFELTAIGGTGEEVSASVSVTSVNAPKLAVSVKANAPCCHGGDEVGFTLSVTEGLELSKVSIRASQSGRKFYETDAFTESLTVTPPAIGKVSEVSVTLSVTDIYGRTAEKTVSIPCAVHAPESRAHWEATMKGVKKTGVWPEDLLAIARTQIGYKESSKDFGLKYDGGISGYTRYGDWAGMPYEEWCAMFACFCLHYAGIEEKDFPYASNCQRWINALKKKGLYARRTEYTPTVGDLALFDWQNDNDSDHVGIIFEVVTDDDGAVKGVKTIEGNSKGGAVYDGKYYGINDGTMIGFGLVNKAYDREIEKHHRDLAADYDAFSVAAGVEPEAKVPAHAALNVTEILPGDLDYDRLLTAMRAQIAEGELGYARFMKVDFVNEDGSETQAQAPLALSFTFNAKMEGDKDFVPGVASMGETVTLNPEVKLERKKRSCAFSFTQDAGEVLCLYATGTLEYKAGTLKARQDKLSVDAEFDEAAKVPAESVLDAVELLPESEAYEVCRAAMGEAFPEEEGVTVRFFDLSLTFNGVPVTPEQPVAVSLDAGQKAETAEVVRVADGMELVAEGTPRKGGKLKVGFNADRFGTYAVIFK